MIHSPLSVAQIVMYLARLHPWPSYTTCSDVSGLARFTSHIPFLFQSRISSLSLFIRYLCCSSFSHVVPSFVLSIGSAFRVRGAFHFWKGGFFCTHSFCAAPTQQYWLCSSAAYSAMASPMPHSPQISHFPLVFAFALGLKLICWFGLSVSRCHSWRSLPLHSHVGYRHQVHIRGSFAISSRVIHLGPRTSRTCSRSLQFGYRTSRTCSRSLQFGYRTSRTCSDQSSPHYNPTQSPTLNFRRFSLDVWPICLLLDQCNGVRLFSVFYLVFLVLGI